MARSPLTTTGTDLVANKGRDRHVQFRPLFSFSFKDAPPARRVGRVRRRRARDRRRLGVGLRLVDGRQRHHRDPSPALAKGAPSVVTSPLASVVTEGADLPFDWEGRWGSLSADHLMATVDLSAGAFTGKTYNIALLLANTSVLTQFASLQLELEIIDAADAGTPGDCATADFDGTNDQLILDSDDEDSGVYWNAHRRRRQVLHRRRLVHRRRRRRHLHPRRAGRRPTTWPTFITTVERAS